MNERCPKCGSDAFLSEEEFAGNVDNSDPPKVAIKQVFKCKACGEKFSRIVFENLEAKKKPKPDATKKMDEIFEGFHKPGVGLEEPDRIEVF